MLALLVLSVLAALVWTGLTIGNPFPPKTVVMATGPEGSASQEFAARYREILARAGVDLVLTRTEGGAENLALLAAPDSRVSVAFVESGLVGRTEHPELASLGTVTVGPLWIFLRNDPEGGIAEKLQGKRISIEPEGSATRVLVRRVLALNSVDESKVELLGLTPEGGAEALLRGEIDGVMMLTTGESPAVRKLLAAEGITLQSHRRADAYVALFPSLCKVVLPEGAADLARNIPPRDIPLVGVETSLLVRRKLHPATQYLLLEAASEIHGGPGLFHRVGRFPAPEAVDVPLSEQARSFYRSGRPFVYRYLPLWLAGLTERLLIILLPLFAVVFPVAHFLPSIIAFVTERRIYALYGELKVVELELERTRPVVALDELAGVLEDLGRRANRFRVPLGYTQRLFILKSHIAMAQAQVEERRRVQAATAADTPPRS
jgi:TRAP-type uncharacterized transport system substrate-binding protein